MPRVRIVFVVFTAALATLYVLLRTFVFTYPRLDLQKVDFDGGTVRQDSEPVVKIPIRNAGRSSLSLYGMKTSCGCTEHTIVKNPIPPGENSEISLKFNLKGTPPGKVNYSLWFKTDDPKYQSAAVKVSFDIVGAWHLIPDKLHIYAKRGEKVERTVLLVNQLGTSDEISSIDSSSDLISAERKEVSIYSNINTVVHKVSVQGDLNFPGPEEEGVVRFSLTDPENREIELKVFLHPE